jgi:hypothetical protein
MRRFSIFPGRGVSRKEMDSSPERCNNDICVPRENKCREKEEKKRYWEMVKRRERLELKKKNHQAAIF